MDNVFFQSFIDGEKWNGASWAGTAFFCDPNGVRLPCLGIMFADIDLGKQIFSDWIERLGPADKHEELRSAIVEGEILGVGPGYSVHISSDPTHTLERARLSGVHLNAEITATASLIYRMRTKPGSPHLSRFKQEFAKHKRYLLIPASADAKPQLELTIEKTEILCLAAAGVKRGDADDVVFPEHYVDGDDAVN